MWAYPCVQHPITQLSRNAASVRPPGGMDLNPVFTSLSEFSTSPSSSTHAPTLFELSRVRLVHGWLADPQAPSFAALEKVNDYDAATNLIVNCDAIMGGGMVESIGGTGAAGDAGLQEAKSEEERRMIQEGEPPWLRQVAAARTYLAYHSIPCSRLLGRQPYAAHIPWSRVPLQCDARS